MKSHNTSTIVEFYKEKQRRRTGSEDNYAQSIKVNTAEGELRETLLPDLR
jgi:hypothetical protein